MNPRFRYPHNICFDSEEFEADMVINKLSSFITERRQERINSVIENRTSNIGVLTEKIYDTGNIAAVVRSMELMGYLNLDIVESTQTKVSGRISTGAEKWINIKKWKETKSCVSSLKEQGYQIVATALEKDSVPMMEIDFTKPTVICLGNEKDGVSEELLEASDYNCLIPSSGFAQSFNISVAAAILLSYINLQRIEKMGHHGDLSEEEKRILKAHYYFKACPNLQKYLKELK